MAAILSLVIYESIEEHVPRWVMQLEAPPNHIYQFQIHGTHPAFMFEESSEPEATEMPKEVIGIWKIESGDVEKVREVAARIPIEEQLEHWNCQDWCLDFIGELEEEYIIGVDDEASSAEEVEAWKALKKRLRDRMTPEV